MKAKDSIVNSSEIKFKNIEGAKKLEWIETNGLGGWASSTVYGLNTRRYHGLLIAAKNPPVGRINLLSKLDETVIVNGQDYQLGSNQYPGVVHPNGFEYLKSFRRDLFPEFYYECGEV
ncbi:MAG: glycogen debranching enzyme N-terminal domain-containing protein, partial [Bacteroidetes bacterium]|nr:glycogen debranching enzyme N-terminal domain-containing protein [Bacteroidota bacterium]